MRGTVSPVINFQSNTMSPLSAIARSEARSARRYSLSRQKLIIEGAAGATSNPPVREISSTASRDVPPKNLIPRMVWVRTKGKDEGWGINCQSRFGVVRTSVTASDQEMGDTLVIIISTVEIGSLSRAQYALVVRGIGHQARPTNATLALPARLLIPKSRRRWRLLDKFCSVRSAVDRQVSFLIGDSETRFPGTAL